MNKNVIFTFALTILFVAILAVSAKIGYAELAVNTNISSLNAQKNLSETQCALQRSMNRLSGGYRIDSASDDAAGLGMSESLKASIEALERSSRTIEDSISLLQTSERILTDTENILKDVRKEIGGTTLEKIDAHLGMIAKDREELSGYAMKIDEAAQEVLAAAERTGTLLDKRSEDQPERKKRRNYRTD